MDEKNYKPEYENVTDHNGKLVGVRWVNADKRPIIPASSAPGGEAVDEVKAAAPTAPEATQAPKGVTLAAFKGADTKQWHIAIRHPFGTSWVKMTDPRDIKLAELLADHPAAAPDSSAQLLSAAREVLSTELGEMASDGSMAPCEHALGLLDKAVKDVERVQQAAAPDSAQQGEDEPPLPRPDCTYADHSYPAYSRKTVEQIRRTYHAHMMRKLGDGVDEQTIIDAFTEHGYWLGVDKNELEKVVRACRSLMAQARAENARLLAANRDLITSFDVLKADHDKLARAAGDTHAFKNFHRSLCERFGYTHDERDWRRDQVSLIEHIAKQAERAAGAARKTTKQLVDETLAALEAENGETQRAEGLDEMPAGEEQLLPVGTLAWALIHANGNIIIWSRNRSTVEGYQSRYPTATLSPIIGAAGAERAVPEGFVIVPRNYTDTQLAAGVAQYNAVAGRVSPESICGVIYDGMVAAAIREEYGTGVSEVMSAFAYAADLTRDELRPAVELFNAQSAAAPSPAAAKEGGAK